VKLGQTAGIAEDLQAFEMRRSILPRSLWGAKVPGNAPATPSVLDLEPGTPRSAALNRAIEVDPEEIQIRAGLARAIQRAGELEVARIETDKLLILDPDHISARTMRVEQSIEAGQFDAARREFETILRHPRLMDYFKGSVDSLKPFHNITQLYLQAERVDDAQAVARAARDFAYTLKRDIGWSQFYLAQVYAVKARTDPRYIKDAADQLYRAFVANPGFKEWYQGRERSDGPGSRLDAARERRASEEPIPARFDPVRPQIDEALRKLENSAEIRRRMASAAPKRK
jgi:tetratricopeptide (TPR) repeat protein